MARTSSSSTVFFCSHMGFLTILALLVIFSSCSSAQLSTNFYSKSCPKVFSTVKSAVQSAVSKERRMGASLVRLFFHDCFVNGCDGSILLEDTSNFKGEQTAGPNQNSVRGFNVVAKIKSEVEKVCPGIVSCADILAIAARDSTVILGGPNWNVKLGRRDSKTASLSAANSGVIPPPTSTLSNLINRFQAKGLSTKDMVALSGSHTIGQARCVIFRTRIYNETNIDTSFATNRQKSCPLPTGSGDNNLAPLDVQTPTGFDNNYYKNLINQKGLLHSDQVLFNGGSTDPLVRTYSKNPSAFNYDFVEAMIKMGDIDPLTGSQGEQTAGPNQNSVRGFNVVAKIKSEVEKVCLGIVSCADILAIAARDSTVILGGPNWNVKLGRRDSKTASLSAANSGVIPPPTSTLSNLINRFQAKGLSTKDMVALSGSHTIGKIRCVIFRTRIYNETNIDTSFATNRQKSCPLPTGSGDNNLAPLDVQTPTAFDNNYYKNLINQKGLLHCDQVLFNGGSTYSLIRTYSKSPSAFNFDFMAAMIKMGDIDPLTGSQCEIRKQCSNPN